MNDQQQRFFIYIMEKIEPRNQAKAQELLADGFARQESGTFTPDYMNEYSRKMLELIKKEHIDEVKYIIQNFRA